MAKDRAVGVVHVSKGLIGEFRISLRVHQYFLVLSTCYLLTSGVCVRGRVRGES